MACLGIGSIEVDSKFATRSQNGWSALTSAMLYATKYICLEKILVSGSTRIKPSRFHTTSTHVCWWGLKRRSC